MDVQMASSSSDDLDEFVVRKVGSDQKLRVKLNKIKKPPKKRDRHSQGLKDLRQCIHWLYRNEMISKDIASLSTVNVVDEYTTGTGSTLCRHCGISFCTKNGMMCNDCLAKHGDSFTGIPTSFDIKHCESCESYSFSGRTEFFSAPPRSATLLRFLLSRIKFQLDRLRLPLITAMYLPARPGTKNISICIILEEESPHGVTGMKRLIVDFVVVGQTCYTCSNMAGTALKWKSVVKIRQSGGFPQSHSSVLFFLPRTALGYDVKNCMPARNGMDLFFADNTDAQAFYDHLCSLAPIMPAILVETLEESYIDAVLCPFSMGDLHCIRPEDMASWGFSGPLAICAGVSDCIHFSDPFSLMRRTISSAEYWKAPFEPLKTYQDLRAYLVLDVQIAPTEKVGRLADVEVARVSDFGKRDETFTVRTHLGGLKPGDHALGYDLCGIQGTGPLPEAVLIKRKQGFPGQVQRKKKTPEYEKFMKDLDKNPEAMFTLSLKNGNNVENQQPETASVKAEENSDFDVEGLLADLQLGGFGNVDTPNEQLLN